MSVHSPCPGSPTATSCTWGNSLTPASSVDTAPVCSRANVGLVATTTPWEMLCAGEAWGRVAISKPHKVAFNLGPLLEDSEEGKRMQSARKCSGEQSSCWLHGVMYSCQALVITLQMRGLDVATHKHRLDFRPRKASLRPVTPLISKLYHQKKLLSTYYQ